MKKYISQLVVFLMFAAGASFAQNTDFSYLYGLNNTNYHKIQYKPLDQTYHIYVLGPYEVEKDKQYPTIYLLDGGLTYPLLASYTNYSPFADHVDETIIVGISYGTRDWKKGNNRSRDFTAESEERDFWGGAPEFTKFLNEVLFPMIETSYPSNAEKRILFGQSLGGQFVLHTAQTNPGLFAGYIASNPALHRNLEFYLESKPVIEKDSKKVKLYVSSGSNDDPVFGVPAAKWMAFWNEQKDLPWLLKTEILEGENHFSAAPAAFRKGINWIFAEGK